MSGPRLVGPGIEPALDWLELVAALEAGHALPRPELGDTFLYRGEDTLLSRSAWITGLGIAIKSITIVPGNARRGRPAINGSVSLFDDATGCLSAMVDFHLVTKWKTCADSLLGAAKLAPPGPREVLIVGAGTVGRSLREGYGALFPEARFRVWNRGAATLQAFLACHPETEVEIDLEAGIRRADVVTVATMTTRPLIRGAWLRPGQHLDLIGAYRPDMREADDDAIRAGRLFVDSRATTMNHIGEIADPLARGVIAEADILGDFHDLSAGAFTRGPDDLTVFKNGGGAHLDLITARYILDVADRDAG